jgi:predicted N-acetyltransferase YhbS
MGYAPAQLLSRADVHVQLGLNAFQTTPVYNYVMLSGRILDRDEIKKIWTIDRSEVIEAIYYLEDGNLVLKPEHYDMQGWPPGEGEKYTPVLEDCFDRGGWFYGLFNGDQLVGVAILENHFIGSNRNLLQLKFLHISSKYRNQGFGKRLFDLARAESIRRGAKGIYISATPSENTINFYLSLGCKVSGNPDPDLFELEPEDIHLELDFYPTFQG